MLKPPKFGNCRLFSNEKENESKITIEEFKTIFSSTKKSYHEIHVENLKNKLDNFVKFTDWECDDVIDHYYAMANVVDCIIYYITGFVCKKMLQRTVCEKCRKAFQYNSVKEILKPFVLSIKLPTKQKYF